MRLRIDGYLLILEQPAMGNIQEQMLDHQRFYWLQIQALHFLLDIGQSVQFHAHMLELNQEHSISDVGLVLL